MGFLPEGCYLSMSLGFSREHQPERVSVRFGSPNRGLTPIG